MECAVGIMTREDVCPRCRGISGGRAVDVRLGEYVDRIAAEFHERVEHQRSVMRKVLAETAGGEAIGYCPLVECSRIETLRTAIRETVAALEDTRSAFKSKRLEVTRKRLIEILAES